jgi:hypothetical protein
MSVSGLVLADDDGPLDPHAEIIMSRQPTALAARNTLLCFIFEIP